MPVTSNQYQPRRIHYSENHICTAIACCHAVDYMIVPAILFGPRMTLLGWLWIVDQRDPPINRTFAHAWGDVTKLTPAIVKIFGQPG
jgi:hypothetical protein